MSDEKVAKEAIRMCNFGLRFLSVVMFLVSALAAAFSNYDRSAWSIGMAVFFRIIANEGPQ